MTSVYQHTMTKIITLYANLKKMREKKLKLKKVLYIYPFLGPPGYPAPSEISSGGTVAYFKQAK